MKKLYIIFLLAPLLSFAGEISVEDLHIKNAPAFVLIGVEPTTVQKPGSAKSFGLALAGAAGGSGSDGGSISNAAIETSPYWWFGGKNVTVENYYNYEKEPKSIPANALRTFTLSLGTKDKRISPVTGDTTGSSLGVGFRSRLLIGKPNEDAVTKLSKLKAKLTGEAGKITIDDWVAAEELKPGESKLEGIAKGGEVFKQISADVMDLRKSLENPTGFQLEVAGGTGFESDEKDLSSPKLKRWGVWLNGSYRPIGDSKSFLASLDLVSVARYLETQNAADTKFDAFDVGGKLFWSRSDQPLSFSVEYVYRFHSREDSKKFALMAEYIVNESTSIFITNGKDFGDDTTGKRPAFTYLGLNFAVGKGAKAKTQ